MKRTQGRGTYGHIIVAGEQYMDRMDIGAFTSIGPSVFLITEGYQHNPKWITTYPFADKWNMSEQIDIDETSKRSLTIGSDVWIGAGVTLFSDTTIADGVVLGAQAVVKKSVGPYAIMVGNPAKCIGYRFEPRQIDALLRLKWWEKSDDEIWALAPLLCSDRIGELLEKLNEK